MTWTPDLPSAREAAMARVNTVIDLVMEGKRRAPTEAEVQEIYIDEIARQFARSVIAEVLATEPMRSLLESAARPAS